MANTAKNKSDQGARRSVEPKRTQSGKTIKVNLALQIVEAFEGNERILRCECVTGDKANPTDRGTFKIWDRRHPWTSRAYGVRMDYAMFFTADGKALHQYHGVLPLSVLRTSKRSVTDWIGSKGCVRLHESDAKALWNWASIGTTVVIF